MFRRGGQRDACARAHTHTEESLPFFHGKWPRRRTGRRWFLATREKVSHPVANRISLLQIHISSRLKTFSSGPLPPDYLIRNNFYATWPEFGTYRGAGGYTVSFRRSELFDVQNTVYLIRTHGIWMPLHWKKHSFCKRIYGTDEKHSINNLSNLQHWRLMETVVFKEARWKMSSVIIVELNESSFLARLMSTDFALRTTLTARMMIELYEKRPLSADSDFMFLDYMWMSILRE